MKYDRVVERDDDLRSSCFASLDVLSATFGLDVPYRGGLDAGFPFRGRRIPFLSPQRASSTRRRSADLPRCRSTPRRTRPTTTRRSRAASATPTAPVARPAGQSSPSHRGHARRSARLLRRDPAWLLQAALSMVRRSGRTCASTRRRLTGTAGRTLDELEPFRIDDRSSDATPSGDRPPSSEPIPRPVLWRTATRGDLPAQGDPTPRRGTHRRDTQPTGEPVVSNGLSLCSIHHRAFDQNLVGVSPTTSCTCPRGSSTTRTARCSSCSRRSTNLRSSCRPGQHGDRIASSSRPGSSASAPSERGSR